MKKNIYTVGKYLSFVFIVDVFRGYVFPLYVFHLMNNHSLFLPLWVFSPFLLFLGFILCSTIMCLTALSSSLISFPVCLSICKLCSVSPSSHSAHVPVSGGKTSAVECSSFLDFFSEQRLERKLGIFYKHIISNCHWLFVAPHLQCTISSSRLKD